jgi:hypothetical protein
LFVLARSDLEHRVSGELVRTLACARAFGLASSARCVPTGFFCFADCGAFRTLRLTLGDARLAPGAVLTRLADWKRHAAAFAPVAFRPS